MAYRRRRSQGDIFVLMIIGLVFAAVFIFLFVIAKVIDFAINFVMNMSWFETVLLFTLSVMIVYGCMRVVFRIKAIRKAKEIEWQSKVRTDRQKYLLKMKNLYDLQKM